jgi:hypothetical protein
MPTARSGIAAAVVNNELWVFGGEEEEDGVFANVEVYNPASNSWRREANMPLPRHGIWASVIGNKVYIPGGGYHAGFVATNTNQIFTVNEAPDSGGAAAGDFNSDGHPDYLLCNSGTQQTGIEYPNNNVLIGAAFGPTLPGGWSVVAVADFNGDGHPDYLLFNATTRATVIWYMNNNVHTTGAYGPTLPAGWSLVGP